jgi:hypothetical protein
MKLKPAAGLIVALTLTLSGCATAATYDGYVHAECDPPTTTAAGKVTTCRSTEKPIPTHTVTVTASAPATTTPPPSPTQTATPKPTQTATPTPTQTITPGTTVPAGVTLKEVDAGGTAYNGKFTPGLPSASSFFPIGVWYESTDQLAQAQFDKETGLNTYFALTGHSRLDYIKQAGMYAFPWASGGALNMGAETVGRVTEDEPDMQPGWWGAPTAEQFTAQEQRVAAIPKDGRSKYTNFGLGILSADDNSAEAKRYVQQYQDYISADFYFYTAPTFEASRAIGKGDQRLTVDQTRRARNYGIVVERMRAFADYQRPVLGFVEVGGPHTENTTAASYIKPDQVRAAMWHSIIGGARGLIFFNHTFGGPAQTQHALRETYYAPIRAEVQKTTATIRQVAVALNSKDAIGLVTNSPGVRALTKWNNGAPLVVAGNEDNAAKSTTFTVKGTYTKATVIGENRFISITNGTFTDSFANGTAVHLYQLS